ncbi:MAG: hypothetical protein JWL95_2060 [Gemmatimonadetes bacterium]|nr:hypothetical protein [Gemmatimonadota bacterium]
MQARVAVAIAVLAVVIGCSDSVAPAPTTTTTPPTGTGAFAVLPGSATLQAGQSVQLTAGVPEVSWTSSNASVVTVSPSGLATSVGVGTALITAIGTRGGVGISSLTVVPKPPAPTLVALSITPAAPSVGVGAAQQFSVAASWSDGSTTAPAVAYSATGGTITPDGLFIAGTIPGIFRVIAAQQAGLRSDTSIVTVTSATATLLRLALAPATLTLMPGATQQFTVSGSWSDGATRAPAVSYSAIGGAITPDGLFTAASAPGTARVIATQQAGALADTTMITLAAPTATLTKLALSPTSATLVADESQQLAVTAAWSDGSAGIPALVWTSSDANVAKVGSSGLVTGVADGVATIVAANGSVRASVAVTVSGPSALSLPTETARSASAFVNSVGLNVHLSYLDRVYGTGYISIIKPRLAELGVRHLRDGGSVFPNADWMSTVYGRYAEVAQLARATFDIVISPYNGGANYSDASHVGTLLSYVGAANVESFEGLNEHDLSGRPAWASEIRSMQQALHAAVKGNPAYASRYAVLGPSLVNGGSPSVVGDLSAYMDVGVAHPYPGGKQPSTSVQASSLAWLRAMNGARPLQATESGYHTAPQSTVPGNYPITESAQGKYVPRLFFENFNAGLARTYLYELIDQGTDRADIEQNFGLLRVDGSPKPAFTALKNTLALLSDVDAGSAPTTLRFGLAGDTSLVHHTVLRKSDGRFYLVLWREVASYDPASRTDMTVAARPLTLQLASAARTVRTYEPNLSAAATAQLTNQRQVSIRVTDQLLVVEIVP